MLCGLFSLATIKQGLIQTTRIYRPTKVLKYARNLVSEYVVQLFALGHPTRSPYSKENCPLCLQYIWVESIFSTSLSLWRFPTYQ